jgi:uncharacterized protein involved in exopolysaccharide biosynthesis
VNEPNLLMVARVIARRFKVIAACAVIAAIAALSISLVLPRVYRAEATIYVLPNPSGGLSSVLRGLALGPGMSDVLGGKNQSDIANYLIAVLESRRLAAEVASTMGLAHHPLFAAAARGGEARLARQVRGCMDIRGEFTGRITVRAETPSPRVSADLANAYVRALKQFVYTGSKGQREFIESRLAGSLRELGQAEEALRRFQRAHGTFELDREAEARINTWSNFSAQATTNDLALQQNARALEVTGSVEDLVRLRAERAGLLARQEGLRRVLERMEQDLGRLPDTGLMLARLKRDAQTKEAIVRLLAEQRESARIAESEGGVKFQVLDSAEAPRAPIRPSKKLNLVFGALLGLVAGIAAALVSELRAAPPSGVPQGAVPGGRPG